MDTRESAQIKDSILSYLLERPNKRESLEAAIHKLQITLPDAVIKTFVEEMKQEGAINSAPISSDRLLLSIKSRGERILLEGGYVKRFKDESLRQAQQEDDLRIGREKSKLEMKHIKYQTWLSIAAISVSLLALYFSIFK